MCLIIDRPAGIKFPEDKLEAAIEQNSDGWGFAVFDRGKIEIIKGFDSNGTNPDVVMRKMDELKDHRLIVHLRFKTHGPKRLENCHPFPIWYDRPDNAYQVHLFHNGVISDFGYDRENRVDSDLFGQEIVKPLLERSSMFMGEANALSDPFLKKIITKYAGSGNRLVLVDTLGNVLHINKESGTEVEGSWCSNSSYFTRYSRASKDWYKGSYAEFYKSHMAGKGTPTKSNVVVIKGEFYRSSTDMKHGEDMSHYTYRGDGKYGAGWYLKEELKGTTPFDQQSSKTESTQKTNTDTTKPTSNGGTNDSSDWPDEPLPQHGPSRKTFKDYLEEICPNDKMLQNFVLSDVTQFSMENIEEMVERYPEMASALIGDLILELYRRGLRKPKNTTVPQIEDKTKVSNVK